MPKVLILQKCVLFGLIFAVEWNEKYRLDPPADDSSFADEFEGETSELMAEYEEILEEYQEMFAADGRSAMEGFFDEMSGETYYEKDDGYEGDLHMSLGALYMSRSDNSESIQAASHLEQAIRLYELSGEAQSQNMASAKFDLSILHLRNGEYRMSARRHGEALDIFRTVMGDDDGSVGGSVEELNSFLPQRELPQQIQPQQQDSSSSSSKAGSATGPAASRQRQRSTTNKGTAMDRDHASRQNRLSMVEANKIDATGKGGPTIVVDVHRFLSQNDSYKDEL